MYIAISPQKTGSTYISSVSDYVNYLEKENEELTPELQESFFNQYDDHIPSEKVIKEIDENTAKLRKTDAKFYSIVVSPSQRELHAVKNNPEQLRTYIRELMKDYAASFHRNEKVSVNDIKYYAKIEYTRTYRGFEKPVLENAPYRKQIVKLTNNIRKVERGELGGSVKRLEKKIEKLIAEAPHKQNGKLIVAGMQKEGNQTHVHIIVSRRDMTNTYTLSPMAKHKASEVQLNGKTVKRGFNRDKFFEASEKTFDKVTGYKRNYVESYAGKKEFIKNPNQFYKKLLGLSKTEKHIAFNLLHKTDIHLPKIPTNKIQLAFEAFKKLRNVSKSVDIGEGY